ncbi:MAG: response regulator [Archangiaceae bacterium]|nr:response regulator [Archangiaceae bacterium]
MGVMKPSPSHEILIQLNRARRGAPGGLVTLDRSGTILSADERACEVLGASAVGSRLAALVPVLAEHPAWVEAVASLGSGLVELEPGASTVQAVAFAPEGEALLVALLVAPLSEVAFQATPAVVLVVNERGDIVEANERALQVFRATGQHPLGRAMAELIPNPLVMTTVRATLSGALGPEVVHIDWERPEGRRVYELRSTRVGKLCVLKLVDVTDARALAAERERLLEAVHQSQKLDAIGQLASGVAHDMNNVLAVVQTCAGALRDDVKEPLHKADAEQILLAAQRARDLLHQLLAFARKTPTRTERFDAIEMAREAASLVTRLLPANVRLSLRLPPEACEVTGDRSQLQQALINISLHARDAMPHGGTIHVSARFDERRVTFSVQDTGEGMPGDVLQRAFEPFFSTKKRGSGTGLGLSMAYTSLRAHRGDIRLESTPGRGTRVTMWLPREWTPAQDDLELSPQGQRRGIALVVDDDEATRKVLARFLVKLGYVVHPASSGEEAVSLLQGGLHPSLVVCDLVMPGLGGAETMARLKTLEPTADVIVTSGFLDEFSIDGGFAGAKAVLRKPFSMDEVAEAVSRVKS